MQREKESNADIVYNKLNKLVKESVVVLIHKVFREFDLDELLSTLVAEQIRSYTKDLRRNAH